MYYYTFVPGSFPDVLKIAEVIPIHRAGPKNICSNYRPISLISPFVKIFGKCLHFHLYNYFTRNNLLNKNQNGFMKKSSTSDAVLDIYNQILQSLNEKKITCSIFFDLAKAFDCTNHDVLLEKLCMVYVEKNYVGKIWCTWTFAKTISKVFSKQITVHQCC